MSKHDRDLFRSADQVSLADMAARADVIFSPGVEDGSDPIKVRARNQGFIAIDANAKGREAIEAIFPGVAFKWHNNGFASVQPEAFSPGWMACGPNVPLFAAKFPNTLPEHLVKLGPLDLKSDHALCFLMAVAARQHCSRTAWLTLDDKEDAFTAFNVLGASDKDFGSRRLGF